MKLLLIDIGNTTVDIRQYDKTSDKLTKVIRPNTNDLAYRSSNVLKKVLEDNNIEIEAIVYSSVVPVWNDIIRALASSLNVEIYSVRNELSALESDFNLDALDKLGADFIANFYGFKATSTKQNAIIVSLGTASTVALVKDLVFQGTYIIPGIGTGLNAMLKNAALLGENKYGVSQKLIGKNTIDAINLGTHNAHYLMIKAIIEQLITQFSLDDCQVIITGGYSLLFKEQIENDHYTFNEQLIFDGMISMFNSKTR
ncbi:type III pantothenate kinase [Spiroplasma culicicola]|uniref:Type III pantothenate kinase n=1 Tax=Spiroplasma culicicola AES-1 TaxID=1276246 RepID=W6A809_9MOLU|nr:type III pantothenate kinase [Spiroplasma culicicola]AHI53263.1 putative transcriptional regulator [Spiroplasma culicicola AES-1]